MKKNLLLLVSSVCVSLLLLEGLIRVFLPKYDPTGQLWIPLSISGDIYIGQKGVTQRHWTRTGDFDVMVSLNEFGLREAKDLQKATEQDWFVVGDSFSFGWGVEEHERYSNRLEELLKARVYNISTLGDFNEYAKLVDYKERIGAPVRRLIIGVCMENDLRNYEEPTILRKRAPFGLGDIKAYLEKKSALYQAVATKVHSIPPIRELAYKFGLLRRASASFNDTFALKLDQSSEYSTQVLASSARRLGAVVGDREAWIVIIPSRGLWLGDYRQTVASIHEEFIAQLKVQGMRVIDLRQRFEEGDNPLKYHFANNGHWNRRGHELAARVIAAHIRGNSERLAMSVEKTERTQD